MVSQMVLQTDCNMGFTNNYTNTANKPQLMDSLGKNSLFKAQKSDYHTTTNKQIDDTELKVVTKYSTANDPFIVPRVLYLGDTINRTLR